MFFTALVVGKIVKRGSVIDDNDRAGIQYQKITSNKFSSDHSVRPIIANGSSLRQAFDETSEEEVWNLYI